MPEPIDDVDRQIIRCLQDEPRASYAHIARQVSVSEATVRRRITALTEEGVIITAVLPVTAELGYSVRSMVGLKAAPGRTSAIVAALAQLDGVTTITLTIGRWDMVCYVAAGSVQELSDYIQQHVATIDGVRELESLIIVSYAKTFEQWRVPLNGRQPRRNGSREPDGRTSG